MSLKKCNRERVKRDELYLVVIYVQGMSISPEPESMKSKPKLAKASGRIFFRRDIASFLATS